MPKRDHADTKTTGNQILLAGILRRNSDADQFPILELAPDGHIAFVGGALTGTYETYQMVDISVRLGHKRLDAMMTIGQAEIVSAALKTAIQAARECEGGGR